MLNETFPAYQLAANSDKKLKKIKPVATTTPIFGLVFSSLGALPAKRPP